MKIRDIITFVIVLALILLAFLVSFKSEEKCYDKGFTTYTVVPNDTIWSIAEGLDGNTEKIVYTIKKDNNIQNSGNLQIGQQIVLRNEY